jgi:hypothetical protein
VAAVIEERVIDVIDSSRHGCSPLGGMLYHTRCSASVGSISAGKHAIVADERLSSAPAMEC